MKVTNLPDNCPIICSRTGIRPFVSTRYGSLVFCSVVMAARSTLWWVVAALVAGQAWTTPLSEPLPLGLLSDVTSQLGHPSRLQQPRLVLPSPQDIENIKKVAQILVMLGQQVIPGIIGEPPTSSSRDPVLAAGQTSSDDDDDDEKHNTM